MGMEQPVVFYSDDAVKDRAVIESVFPSLKNGKPILNKSLKLAKLPPDHSVIETSDLAETNEILQEIMNETDVVGLDCEWDYNRSKNIHGSVAVVQVSTLYRTLVIKLSRMEAFPESLKALITSKRHLKVGKNVGGDVNKLIRDYKLGSTDIRNGLVELGKMASRLGVINTGNASLAHITEVVLNLHLQKPPHIRESPWSSANLSPKQLEYAALDSFIGLVVYDQLQKIQSGIHIGASLDKKASRIGLRVAYYNGLRKVAVGTIVPFSPEIESQFALVKSIKKKCFVKVEEICCPTQRLRYCVTDDAKTFGDIGLGTVVCLDYGALRVAPPKLKIVTSTKIEEPSEISPEAVEGSTTRVIQDIWHVMERMSRVILKKHGFCKDFMFSLMNAFFIHEQEDLERVKAYLSWKGHDFDAYLKYKSDWIHQRVRRIVPPAGELYNRVKKVFDFYETVQDAASGMDLFNEKAKKESKLILDAILDNYLSDPVGVSLYSFEGYDSHRLPLYKCVRGTNATESIHSNLISHFSAFNCTPVYADSILAMCRHRHNFTVGRMHRRDAEKFKHFDVWVINELHSLSRKVYTNQPQKFLFKKWQNSDEFESTTETFGLVKLSDEVRNEYEFKSYDGYADFVCEKMNLKYPLRPVYTPAEKRLFQSLISSNGTFESRKMAIEFNRRANGRDIFYKTKEIMEKYERKEFKRQYNAVQSRIIVDDDQQLLHRELTQRVNIIENPIEPLLVPEVFRLKSPTTFTASQTPSQSSVSRISVQPERRIVNIAPGAPKAVRILPYPMPTGIKRLAPQGGIVPTSLQKKSCKKCGSVNCPGRNKSNRCLNILK
jgi:hypothetical protein